VSRPTWADPTPSPGSSRRCSTWRPAAVFLLGQIDAWIGARPETIVNYRRRSVAPVVRERISVADHLSRLLGQLGLERKARPGPTLAQYLALKAQDAARTTTPPSPKPASAEPAHVAQRGAGASTEPKGAA